MNGQFKAAWQLHRFLTERDIPYVIIDGIAVQRWGEPRLTIDVDLAILLPAGGEERRLREIAAAFPPRLKDAVAFALEHRVLPIDVPGASAADLSMALPGFEEAAIAGAVDYDLGQGRTVRLCTAEDLIVYKCVAGRPQDVMDVESIVARQGDSLDVAHIRRWVEEFARITEDGDIVARFERVGESPARLVRSRTFPRERSESCADAGRHGHRVLHAAAMTPPTTQPPSFVTRRDRRRRDHLQACAAGVRFWREVTATRCDGFPGSRP